MTREDIEKAAEDFVMQNSPSFVECFRQGAEWRINSVWHNASEIPKLKSKAILAIRRDGSSERVFFLERKRWENFIKHCDIINWAYIDDLTPKEE